MEGQSGSDCAVGYFSSSGYADSSVTCSACPAGEDQDQTGQTSCSSCPARVFQDQTGQTSYISCPANSLSLTVGQSGCDCAIGYSSSSGYEDSSEICNLCGIGEY